jgi:hypothetical protein
MSTTIKNNIQEQNQDILNDIQSLQNVELELFNSLETNNNLTTTEQQSIISKIDSISSMRIDLYQTMGGVNKFFHDALNNSRDTLQDQTAAISIIEKELNNSKIRLSELKQDKLNKIRLIEINDYYGEKYEEQTKLMKITIAIIIPIVILVVLRQNNIIPQMFFSILLMIIIIVGSVIFLRQLSYIMTRDNMSYQEFNWGFDAKNAPKPNGLDPVDPWLSNNLNIGSCIGQRCCSTGLTYNTTLNQCVGPSIQDNTGLTATDNNTIQANTDGFSNYAGVQ